LKPENSNCFGKLKKTKLKTKSLLVNQ